MTRIYAIDPGPEESALVIVENGVVIDHTKAANAAMLTFIRHGSLQAFQVLVIEQIASFGMAVGAEVFETCVWTGRFIEAWGGGTTWHRVKRHEVKTVLCHTQKAKDANIRQALIDRFGPGKDKAIGNKRQPGPLYGIAGDEWSALAVAVTWRERNRKDGAHGNSGQR